MEITKSTTEDLDLVLGLYNSAIEHQKKIFYKSWKGFDRDEVKEELAKGIHYKIIEKGEVICIFMISYNDPEIWGEKDKEPSIYLHRIVTHPNHRGRFLVKNIRDWAIAVAHEKSLKYIRMDTWGDNPKLRDYYKNCGFTYLGVFSPADSSQIPQHYSRKPLAFFQLEVK